MLGGLIGDVVGSRFEHSNHKSKIFDLFTFDNCPTDDSVMTLAIAKAVLDAPTKEELGLYSIRAMQELGREYYYAGFGRKFYNWLFSNDPKPYYSWGNGAAMRISPVAYVADTLTETIELSRIVTEITHNHPEGIKGAESVAVAIWESLHDWSKEEIRDYICSHYYNIDFTLDEIRPEYSFHVSCQKSVPQAFEAFFESNDFEDSIRNAISIGGDSDTIACITGSIAGAYYGVPQELVDQVLQYFDPELTAIIKQFAKKYMQ